MGNLTTPTTTKPVAKRPAPSVKPEPTVWERLKGDVAAVSEAAARGLEDFTGSFDTSRRDASSRSMVGAGARELAYLTGRYQKDGESDAAYKARIAAAEKARRNNPDNSPKPQGAAGVIGSLLGGIIGGADPTYVIAPGESTLARMGAQGVVQGAGNVATQGIEKQQGVRDNIDWNEAKTRAAEGVLFQGGVEGVGKLAKSVRGAPEAPAPAPEVEAPVARPMTKQTIVQHGDNTVSQPANDVVTAPEPMHPIERRARIKAATEYLDGTKPGETKTVQPFPENPGEEDYHRFRHVTEDGKTVTGTYTYDPNEGVIDNFSINSEGGANKVGPSTVRSIGRQLQEHHPDATTLRAYRTSGARANEEFVDIPLEKKQNFIQKLAANDEGSVPRAPDEPADPTAPIEPTGPTAETPSDRKVGSIGPGQGIVPEQLQHFDNPEKVTRSAEEIAAAGDDLGLTPENFPKEGKVGDLSAVASRGQAIVHMAGNDLLSAYDKHGPGSAEYQEATESFIHNLRAHSANSGEFGRALGTLNNHEYLNAAEARRLHELATDPKHADKFAKLVEKYRDDPNALVKIARDAVDPTFRDRLFSFRYNMMLSGLTTHAYNITGNTLNLIADAASHSLGYVWGLPKKAIGNTNRITSSELAARLSGSIVGARRGLQTMKQAYAEGRPLDNQARTELERGRTGKWEIPVKALSAEDEMFRSIAHYSNQYGESFRVSSARGLKGDELKDRAEKLIQLANVPKSKIEAEIKRVEKIGTSKDHPYIELLNDALHVQKNTIAYAKRMRFQDDPSFVGQAFERMRTHKDGEGPIPSLGKDAVALAVPFVRTPDSLARTAIRYSPLAPIESVNVADLKAGGARRDLALGRITMAAGLSAYVATKVIDGGLTGKGPSDYKQRQAWEQNGWQQDSIKVGDKYYSYDGMEPLSILLSGVATTMERWHETDGKGYTERSGDAVMGIADTLAHQSWAEGLSDFFDALDEKDPDQKAAKLNNVYANAASSFTDPAIVRQFNQAFGDNVTRDTRGDDSAGDRIVGRMESGWPSELMNPLGLKGSKDLPAQHDALGRKLGKEDPLIMSRAKTSITKPDAVTNELDRLMKSDPLDRTPITTEDKTLRTEDYPIGRMSAKTYQKYQSVVGLYTHALLAAALKDPEYQKMSDLEKMDYVREQQAQAREWGRQVVFDRDGQ